MVIRKLVLGFAGSLLLVPNFVEAQRKSLGSVSVTVSQRFFNDEKLGLVNGFSEWGAIEIDSKFGVYEFPYRLEPYIGFGYIQDTASLYNLNDDGSYVLVDGHRTLSDLDHLKYKLFSFTAGLRQKAWEPDFFFIIPHAFAGMVYRFGRVQKVTYGVGQQKVNLGGDFGAEIGGGFLISFFYDAKTRVAMDADWGLKDFSLVTSIRYLPAGWWRHGLGLLKETGGWDFGLGLYLDW